MRRMALIGLAVMMAFVLATPALYAQQGTQAQTQQPQQSQGQFVCPGGMAGQAGMAGPHHGRMGGGHRMMGGRCMMMGANNMPANNMPANCPRMAGTNNATPPAAKQ